MEVIFLLEYVVGWSRAAMLNSAPDTPTRRALANTSTNKVSVESHKYLIKFLGVGQSFRTNVFASLERMCSYVG
jgi:hypothetical protein